MPGPETPVAGLTVLTTLVLVSVAVAPVASTALTRKSMPPPTRMQVADGSITKRTA